MRRRALNPRTGDLWKHTWHGGSYAIMMVIRRSSGNTWWCHAAACTLTFPCAEWSRWHFVESDEWELISRVSDAM